MKMTHIIFKIQLTALFVFSILFSFYTLATKGDLTGAMFLLLSGASGLWMIGVYKDIGVFFNRNLKAIRTALSTLSQRLHIPRRPS